MDNGNVVLQIDSTNERLSYVWSHTDYNFEALGSLTRIASSQNNDTETSKNTYGDSEYIGLRVGGSYGEPPSELEALGGWGVVDIDQPSSNEPGFSVHSYLKGDELLLFFYKGIDNNVAEVLDVIAFPTTDVEAGADYQNKTWAVANFCSLSDNPYSDRDWEIVTLAKKTNTEFFTEHKQAWRANKETEVFEPISTEGISCENDSYGI